MSATSREALRGKWILSIVLVVAFLVGGIGVPWGFDTSVLRTRQVAIVVVGSDPAIAHTAAELRTLLPFASTLSVSSVDALAYALEGGHGTVILVGHGEEQGLLVSGRLLSWEALGRVFLGTSAHTVLAATCYSETLRPHLSDRHFFGFAGLVDVDEAAFVVASFVYGFRGNLARVQELLFAVTEIMVEKALGLSDRPLETLGYSVKPIRNIWHVKYSDQYGSVVSYTHPDNYLHYTYIGLYSSARLVGSNLEAGHLSKSLLDALQLTQAISAIWAGAWLAFIVTGLVGIIVGAILATFGVLLSWLINSYVRDEAGAGWAWIQNVWSAWYGYGLDMKVGGIMWFHGQVIFGVPTAWPLWYGGQALGIDGW